MTMKKLLIIDPQNDFCDIPNAALPVEGAQSDLQRLAAWVEQHAQQMDGITVTLDSHASVAVERTTFWQTQQGDAVAPFTFLTSDDVLSGKFVPRDRTKTAAVLAMLEQLAARGRPGLVVWPVHCVTGTWGHNIYNDLAVQLQAWEFSRQRAVVKALKGEYPLTEHFGVFEADAPVQGVPSTQFNTTLAKTLTDGVDVLFLAGQASSHCVASSFDQLANYLKARTGAQPKLVILRDCMSPVGGFEAAANDFFDRAKAFGAEIMTAHEAGSLVG
jgi:nicotinamidase/pyrazinamidase